MALHGARFNWNVVPSTRLEASRISAPLGCLFTPFQGPYASHNGAPIACSCGAYINPFIKLERTKRMWWCPLCHTLSTLPADYVLPAPAASDREIPVELRLDSISVDYTLPLDISDRSVPNTARIYAFVVDLYQHTDDISDVEGSSFAGLKRALIGALSNLPPDSFVFLITLDESVAVHRIHENSFVAFAGDELFDRNPRYDFKNIFDDILVQKRLFGKLEIDPKLTEDCEKSALVQKGYLIRLNNGSAITDYVSRLSPTPTNTYKPLRSTGLACFITTVLLSQATYQNMIGRVFLFLGGPGTLNPGMILNTTHSRHNIRSHNNINQLLVTGLVRSQKFYQTLALAATGYSLKDASWATRSSSRKITDHSKADYQPTFSFNLFSGSHDQVGIYEMSSLAVDTCGFVSINESFASKHFNATLGACIKPMETPRYNATMTITTSLNLKISKVLSHGTPLQSSYSRNEKSFGLHNERISDTLSKFDSSLKKRYFTNRWWYNDISDPASAAVFFEPQTVSSTKKLDYAKGLQEALVQFLIKSWDASLRRWKLRVTTIKKPTTIAIATRLRHPGHPAAVLIEEEFLKCLDVETWTVLLTRLLVDRNNLVVGYDSFEDIVKRVDECLIQLLHHFGGLSLDLDPKPSDIPISLTTKYVLNDHLKSLPAIFYHLRRNPQLINIFNSSPDETAYNIAWFMRANTENSLTMIKPKFYLLGEKTVAVPLALDTLGRARPGQFLVFDSLFNIIVYYNYREAHEKLSLHPSNNEDILFGDDETYKAPLAFVKSLTALRLLPSKIVITQTNHSQARFLMARLSPKDREVVSKQPERGFWSTAFASLSLSSDPVYLDRMLMTDELSLQEYYDGLIELVKNHRTGDDQ